MKQGGRVKMLVVKTDSLDLKENAQEIIQTNERRQAFLASTIN